MTILGDVKSKGYTAIVVDDFSFMAEQSLSGLEKKYKGYDVWGNLRDLVLEFRDKVRFVGIDVILSCWERGPRMKDGALIRGGPLLSGKLAEQLPAMCDVVLRAVHEPARKPWPVVYKCSTDPNWVMKDRLNVAGRVNPTPMNLGELLRAAGVVIPRLEKYPTQEEEVEVISRSMSGDPVQDVALANSIFKGLVAKGKDLFEARWTVRDAMDRATIRKGLADSTGNFIDTTGLLL